MPVCTGCGATVVIARCPVCDTEMYPADDAHFPPVTWAEVRDHITAQLLIDDEWRVDDEASLTWWPWFLHQTIYVDAEGEWEDDEPGQNFLHVVARTNVGRVEKDLGLEICAAWNADFPLGAFVWDDGVLFVISTLSLNPLCRELLPWFHEAVLAQATFAHLAALQLRENPGVEILATGHPQTGAREEPDELLSIFAGETRGDGVEMPGLEDALATARRIYQQRFEEMGWEPGFRNEDVDFFTGSRVECAIGRVDGSELALRFGLGLVVWVRLTRPGVVLDDDTVNSMHIALAAMPRCTLIGRLQGDESGPEHGTQLHSYLPMGFLGRLRTAPDALAISILNAALHCSTTITQFLIDVDRIAADATAADDGGSAPQP